MNWILLRGRFFKQNSISELAKPDLLGRLANETFFAILTKQGRPLQVLDRKLVPRTVLKCFGNNVPKTIF
jgi:hypothetical protein